MVVFIESLQGPWERNRSLWQVFIYLLVQFWCVSQTISATLPCLFVCVWLCVCVRCALHAENQLSSPCCERGLECVCVCVRACVCKCVCGGLTQSSCCCCC